MPPLLFRLTLPSILKMLLVLTVVMLSGCASLTPTATTAPTAAVTVEPAPTPLTPMQIESSVRLRPASQLGLKAPEEQDIWERIRKGFAMPDLGNSRVSSREDWYASRPDYMLRMIERSRPYLFHIVQELERRQMPMELALLPFVESAFNPQAVSTAKAAGMWQFMPATGRTFDLKQNLFMDERRDVLESTRAALDYLQKLYGMFGDWHLALAAYNWGEGNVGRAIARNKARGKDTDYDSLSMPEETRYYVPKLQALKNIISNPEAYNAELPEIKNHPYFKSVSIDRDIDVALAARLAEISTDNFRILNPSFKHPVILAAGTPQILLPWDNADIFTRNLEKHPGKKLASWTAWVAPRNMKLEDAAKEVSMHVNDLRSANNIPPRMLVRAGSTLLVQRKGELDSDVSEQLATSAQLSLVPEVVLRKIAVRARKGDTLTRLAARHGVSASNLATWNNLTLNARLNAGQRLTLYAPYRTAKKAPARRSPRVASARKKR
ncbi:MAG: Membrane-bound lytic murein transglycosylase precursor [Pseudomonadota bacterium]